MRILCRWWQGPVSNLTWVVLFILKILHNLFFFCIIKSFRVLWAWYDSRASSFYKNQNKIKPIKTRSSSYMTFTSPKITLESWPTSHPFTWIAIIPPTFFSLLSYMLIQRAVTCLVPCPNFLTLDILTWNLSIKIVFSLFPSTLITNWNFLCWKNLSLLPN